MTRADIIVVVLAVALLPFLYAYYWGNSDEGREVRVLVGGEEQGIFSLKTNKRVQIQGKLGPSTIEIHNGKVRFVESPCQGKQCVHTGWLNHGGEFAACLPNAISLLVLGDSQRFDAINF